MSHRYHGRVASRSAHGRPDRGGGGVLLLGTNDLTQTTWGFSRDDVEAAFFSTYLDRGIFPTSPFETLDRDGVGRLVKIAVVEGRAARPGLRVGVCGDSVTQLHARLRFRLVVQQAAGVLASRDRIAVADAQAVLGARPRRHRPLLEVAAHVVAHQALPVADQGQHEPRAATGDAAASPDQPR